MKTIAQLLNVKEFPFEIKDENGKVIYYENENGFWWNIEYDSDGNKIYSENFPNYSRKWKYDSDGKEIYYEFKRWNVAYCLNKKER
jgi:phage pi2 protein 07